MGPNRNEFVINPDFKNMSKNLSKLVIGGIIALVVVVLLFRCIQTVPPGHVGVGVLFGSVQNEPYKEGFHIVNPLLRFEMFDARQKTHLEQSNVPSQDQLQTQVDVSVQYRLDGSMASHILRDTGNTSEDVIRTHLVPNLRSLIREQGKTVKKAEEFYLEETQQRLQVNIMTKLEEALAPKGVIVTAVLIRDITLPTFIDQAIQQKKEREQAVEKQKAELERFRTEQEQLIAEAEAKRLAAEKEAEQIKVLADARAYEIKKINEAISRSPAYIQLQALDSLKAISKDPAAKVYFLNGDSPNPLPLMHIGEN